MKIDYHNFTDINTPQEERRRHNVGDIWINAATCNDCKETIRSKNIHDFVTCSCGNISVNGGSWYMKRSSKTFNFTDEIVLFADAKRANIQ